MSTIYPRSCKGAQVVGQAVPIFGSRFRVCATNTNFLLNSCNSKHHPAHARTVWPERAQGLWAGGARERNRRAAKFRPLAPLGVCYRKGFGVLSSSLPNGAKHVELKQRTHSLAPINELNPAIQAHASDVSVTCSADTGVRLPATAADFELAVGWNIPCDALTPVGGDSPTTLSHPPPPRTTPTRPARQGRAVSRDLRFPSRQAKAGRCG